MIEPPSPQPIAPAADPRWARRHAQLLLALALLAGLGLASALRGPGLAPVPPVHAQACPPRCPTPIITPAWHLHMCDVPYQEQLDDNRCMIGPGITEFPAGTNEVYVIYCHQLTDTVVLQIHDSGGGLQWVNHPDGITYSGVGCESQPFSRPNGIPAGGSPFRTSAYWPEGPFTGIGAGIEWYIGLFVSFDAENYYGNDAQAIITARDPGANTNPFETDRIRVRVTSTSDPTGIEIELVEKAFGFSVFESQTPLTFSQLRSDPARNVIKVANRDTIRVEYCPRDCRTPYFDTSTWYNLVATITPTPLPTWSGPAPTATATPPPDLEVAYISLRPAPADVGYVPQVSNNKDRPNHLGYPTLYAGMWTRGTNIHHGMVQFDLSPLPEGARLIEGRLELVGRESRFTEPGTWSVGLLDASIDLGWRDASFVTVHDTPLIASVGAPIDFADLAVGRRNAFGLGAVAIAGLNSRLGGTRRASFRVDGPVGEDNNLFAWESGVDVYNRAPEPPDPALGPVLHLAYSLPRPETATPDGPPSATPEGTVAVTQTASPTPTGPTAPPSPTRGTATASPTPPESATSTPSPSPEAPATASASPTASGPADQRQVCVVAYRDEDGDGARDPAERFLAGVTLRLTHLPTGVFDSWVTDGANQPDHCWSGLIDGGYSLKLLGLPAGLVPSGPAEYQLEVPFPGPPALYSFGARVPPTVTPTAAASPTAEPTAIPSLTPQPTVSGPAGTICMQVFDDRDRDGARGPGEALLPDFELRILDRDRQAQRDLRSLDDQPVCSRLPVGVYYARVLPRSGGSAAPAESAVLLSEGAERLLEFAWTRQSGRAAPIYIPVVVSVRR
ncbi:MAG: hypothetical protein KDH92_07280 [Chloroflexi bacterium]|nr:hypothetical protein [Chloroflexota bacterium]